jgi:hypothetical protein
MRQLYIHYRQYILWQAFRSASVLSLFIYAMFRIFFFEFPLSWTQEAIFFIKMFLSSSFIIVTATGGVVIAYRTFVKLRIKKNAA